MTERSYIDDTIAAVATPLGEGGIGIVRISGRKALDIGKKIFKTSKAESIKTHNLYHGHVIGQGKKPVDEAMLSFMKSPKSYTGEDVVEISCHGGVCVVSQVLELAIKAGARLANKGEFTKRAFLNGKIDLSQAEAVIDLIKARTKEGVHAAASQLRGNLSAEIKDLREGLKTSLALIEANIDFPDDIGKPGKKGLAKGFGEAIKKIDSLLSTARVGKILREGVSAVILGKPNVGKSSVLNALLREERAIVTEVPGTTRDIIEESLNIGGVPIRLIDTAGIRKTKGRVERAGQKRAKEALDEAEIVLIIIDVSCKLSFEDTEILESCKGKKAIVVLNKIDLKTAIGEKEVKKLLPKAPIAKVSALYGDGVPLLENKIKALVASEKIIAGNKAIVTNTRHKECLIRAKESLERATESTKEGFAEDFVAIDLKAAIVALGEITGEAVTDEVLDRIFQDFCVGK